MLTLVVLQVGDDGMKQVEDEALMGLKGAAGLDTSREAMHQVLGHERDLILARFLPHCCVSGPHVHCLWTTCTMCSVKLMLPLHHSLPILSAQLTQHL